jgi:hypothetical protein
MRIFISHATKDRVLASRLSGELANAGFSVWNPDEQIVPGDNWARQIGKALEESDLMVALFTPGSLDSEYVQGNIEYGLTSRHFEHRLVPVLVGYATFEAGKDVPWILLKMNPVYIQSPAGDFGEVVDRVRNIARQETNVAR